jgi:hypothetical protein
MFLMPYSIRKTVVAAVTALGMATAVATISTPAEAQWHGGGGGFHGGGFHGGGFHGGGYHGGGFYGGRGYYGGGYLGGLGYWPYYGGYGNGYGYGYPYTGYYGATYPGYTYSSGYSYPPTAYTTADTSGPYLTNQTYEPGDGYRYPLYYNPATGTYFYYPVSR